MENPEEVLQALDEFQKMRPSEIPRELEDYLCWVAKTGDPVYQWSLIKALFREKLVRVMTEFYENCPSLDLTPCPNVEQFNYNIMKRNLLDRLESFANAPFTVQRICELLTSPRKEYSRIDKFMRAIEKNILVVSTREPGPYGRRSENGDSLVNGSLEDENSRHGQPSNEVDMENWVKDCSTTAAVIDGEKMSVENGLNSSKSSFGKQERLEHQLSGEDTTAPSFATTAEDFSVATVMPTQIPENLAQDSAIIEQNLAPVSQDAANIVTDVSDAIINEDTSSQPTLELESDDNDSNDSKKLQTTFQTKDFTLDDVKSPKLYSDAVKLGKLEETTDPSESNKEKSQVTQIIYSNESQLIENTGNLCNSEKVDNLDAHSFENETKEIDKVHKSQPSENNDSNNSTDNLSNTNINLASNASAIKDKEDGNTIDSSDDKNDVKCDTDVKEEEKTDGADKVTVSDATEASDNLLKESLAKTEVANLNEIINPVVEEPTLEKSDINRSEDLENIAISIEESLEEEPKVSKTMVPDPIPIIEEPKDVESSSKDWDKTTTATEIAGELENITNVKNGITEESDSKSEQVDDNQMVISEDLPNKATSESMDIDNEAVMLTAQQDEPMEQETTESMNS